MHIHKCIFSQLNKVFFFGILSVSKEYRRRQSVFNPNLNWLHSQTLRYRVGTLQTLHILNEHRGLQRNREVEGQE